MGNQHTAGRVQLGLGVESTAGTSVAPTDWMKQVKFTVRPMIDVAENASGVGRIEDVVDSDIVGKWVEWSIEGLVGSVTFPYFLKAFLGTLVTTDNADVNASIKDHTIDTLQTNTPATLTLVRKDPISNKRYAMATVESIELKVPNRGYTTFVATGKAKAGATGTDVPAYPAEQYFTSKHAVTKIASSVAGLSGATAPAVKSASLTLKKSSADEFIPHGADAPTVITTGRLQINGSMVLQYDATTYEDQYEAGTAQAMSLTLQNTDVVIGTAANAKVAFTNPKNKFREFDRSDDEDNVIEQTLGFKSELDLAVGYLTRVVVTNDKASY